MERVPYLVGGGFEHSAEVMRAMLAAATSGAEGIVNAGDFKVQPLAVPGTSVRVAPGNALIRNSYGGGQAQTYAVRAGSETELPIVATGSAGGRSDLVVARVDDPTYQGGAFDPATFEAARFEVVSGVPAGQRDLTGLGLTYPAIPLARIDLPASTGTVTNARITDLRAIAIPRKERYLFVHPLTLADGEKRLTTVGVDGWWPGGTGFRVDVPTWAQRVRVLGQWGGVMLERDGGNAWGRIHARIGNDGDPGAVNTQETSWDLAGNGLSNSREAWMTGDDLSVPVALRGRKGVVVGLRGRVIDYESGASRPLLNELSVVSLDIEFYETAV